MKVDFVTSYDIKIYYTGKFKDFTATFIINRVYFISMWLISLSPARWHSKNTYLSSLEMMLQLNSILFEDRITFTMNI